MEGFNFKKPAIFLLVLVISLAGFFVLASTVRAESPLPAINFAPNFWFDSGEKYYPVNPLDFYFANGLEINGEIAVNKYNQLSLEGKLENLTVFYHIKDEGNQWVYQYWFFYVFNDSLGKIKNKHYGDWEAVFVFVDKESKRVLKVIGTAHQRKIFDTEIIKPENEHIWAYVGNGSHANCLDEEDDGYCNLFKWRFLEKWDKNGHKILYNNYILKEINLGFIEMFKGITTLEKSSELGINIFDFLKIKKEFYISLGGSPPTHAWEQSSYNNPEEIRPISWEYALEKVSQTKDKVAGFFNDLTAQIGNFFKKPSYQQAGISGSIIQPEQFGQPEQGLHSINIEGSLLRPEPGPVVEKPAVQKSEEVSPLPEISLPVEESEPEVVEPTKEEIEDSQPISQSEPPIGFPFFIGGGGASPAEEETEPEPEPEPEPEATTTSLLPPKIISPNDGVLLSQVDDYTTSTTVVDVNLIGTSTPNYSILIFVNSASTEPDYSTTTDSQGDWSQIITLEEGENTIKVKAQDADNNESEEISLTLIVDTIIVDTIPPAAITDLSASSGSQRGMIDLSWTAPGDDESIGTSTEYIIRYATSSIITDINWDSAIDTTNEPTPNSASATETLTVSNLEAGQTYYWAIKSKDKAGNISEISNCASSIPNVSADYVVINEVQVNDSEFIELYNPTSQNINLSDYYFAYYSSNREWIKPYRIKRFPTTTSSIITGGGYYLIGLSDYPEDGEGIVADWQPYASKLLSNEKGAVAILPFEPDEEVHTSEQVKTAAIDTVAWGESENVYETIPYSEVPPKEQSIQRKTLGWDTDNNSQDFEINTNPSPRNSQSVNETQSALVNSEWPVFQQNHQHTGKSPYSGPDWNSEEDVELKWSVNLGGLMSNQPIINEDGYLYIVSGEGKLYKINPTNGIKELIYDTGVSGYNNNSTAVISVDSTIYFAVYNHFYAVNKDTNQLRWYRTLNNAPSFVSMNNQRIYVGDKYKLFSYSPNGELIWQVQLSNGRWVSGVTIDSQDNLYVSGEIGDLASVYKLNLDNGEIITSSTPRLLSNAPPSIDKEGNLYVSALGGYHGGWGLSVLDSSQLNEKAFLGVYKPTSGAPAIDTENSAVYIGNKSGEIKKVDINNLEIIYFDNWPVYLDGQVGGISIDANGVIYAGSKTGKFYAINSDGSIKWSYDIGATIYASPVINSSGTVYVASYNGNVSAFGE